MLTAAKTSHRRRKRGTGKLATALLELLEANATRKKLTSAREGRSNDSVLVLLPMRMKAGVDGGF